MNSSVAINPAGTQTAEHAVPAWKRLLRSPILKVVITLGALGLLTYFNRIDPAAFRGLGAQWPWLVAAFALMLPPYAIVSYRFWLVLRMQGIPATGGQALRWTMIGSFFDVCMPSSSGGDVMKAGYVIRQYGQGWRTRSIMAVAFDRILGLLGLFVLAWLACLGGWNMLRALPQAGYLLLVLSAVCLGSLLLFRLLGSRFIQETPRIQNLIAKMPAGRQLGNIIRSFNAMREHRLLFWSTLGLSVLNHLFWCSSLICICRAMELTVDPVHGLVVFPLAIFGNVFGFAGGFGVGTAAFDLLFVQLIGIKGGAAVGLVFQVMGAISRLTGLPFFLWSRRHPARA